MSLIDLDVSDRLFVCFQPPPESGYDCWIYRLRTCGAPDMGIDFALKMMNYAFKDDDVELKMMNFVLKMMNSLLKMMDFVLKMMCFVLKMMNFGRGIRGPSAGSRTNFD